MARKPNKKRQMSAETESVTAIATRAKCSRTLVLRLLRRGLTAVQIVQRAEERRARTEARSATGNGQSNGRVNGHATMMDFPAVPVPTIPPFAESEKRKEFYLSEIRELQAAKLRGQALPVEPLRSVIFAATHYLTNRLRDLPDELTDDLGPDLTKLLRARIHALVGEAHRVMVWEAARHGIPPPPDQPPAVRSRLASYERFIRDSRSGETEVIPVNERIDSLEWQRLHPSVTFQQGFEILRKKREWDEAMLELLRRRSEWDLPSELPDEPPPEAA
jgi:hypothetical protein